jgi:DNA-binding CsgD family transcriptional regulator
VMVYARHCGVSEMPASASTGFVAPFVGRVSELRVADRCLSEALDGRGGVLLIAGEAGIGKTSLAELVGDRARGHGAPVVWGRCVVAEGAPAFWPWRQVLRGCLATAARDVLAWSGADLADLADLVPELLPPAEMDPAYRRTPSAPGSARFRLFESVTATVAEAGDAAGLVIVLDDLHWADSSSAQLLAHLGRELAATRVLVVATYRDDELAPESPAGDAVAELRRQRTTVPLRLEGLSEAEVAAQLENTYRQRFSQDVVAVVARRSGGNPFFVTEIGRLLEQASRTGRDVLLAATMLPHGARTLIRGRVGRVRDTVREALRAAAVAGAAIGCATAAAAAGLPLTGMLDALDDALAAGLVRRTSTDGIEFTHPLVRDTLVADLPSSLRVEIHRRIAEHLESAHAGELDRHAPALAYHWLGALPAADPRRGVSWAERAAAQALDVLAYQEAAQLYERALGALCDGGLDQADRVRILIGRADSLCKAGDIRAAIADATEAGEESRRAGDPVGMAQAVLTLEEVLDPSWSRTAIRLSQQALAQFGDSQVGLRARLTALLARHTAILWPETDTWMVGDDRSEVRSERSLELAEVAGTPDALMSALRSRQAVQATPDQVRDHLGLAQRILTMAEEFGDPRAALWGRLCRVDAHCLLGDLRAAEAELARLDEIAAQLRQPIADMYVTSANRALAIGRGRFADAGRYLAHAQQLVADGLYQRLGYLNALVGTHLATLTGDPAFEVCAHDLEERSTTPDRAGSGRMYLASYYASRGEWDRAAMHYERLPSWDSWHLPRPSALPCIEERARLAVLHGDVDGATIAYQRLLPWADYFAASGSGQTTVTGSVQLSLGVLAATLGKQDRSARHLRAAIEANQRAGLPPFDAQARFELARVLSRRGDRDRSEALVLASDAARLAEELGMAPLRASADALTGTLRHTSRAVDPTQLTRRQSEIADLLGRGLTNRQIADVLFISERTAENHVKHILHKLGFHNRSQVAAWATANNHSDHQPHLSPEGHHRPN